MQDVREVDRELQIRAALLLVLAVVVVAVFAAWAVYIISVGGVFAAVVIVPTSLVLYVACLVVLSWFVRAFALGTHVVVAVAMWLRAR